jgi:hypothetical protein
VTAPDIGSGVTTLPADSTQKLQRPSSGFEAQFDAGIVEAQRGQPPSVYRGSTSTAGARTDCLDGV